MSDDEILFEVTGGLGRIMLNRPKAFNALTLDQIRAMEPALAAWAKDDSVQLVVIEGAGEKAFCAGGDIRDLYDAGKAGNREVVRSFFTEEYHLNRQIKTFPKPYIALIDGFTMGGGVGISIHGSHRITTERTVFSMPETGIGMFPDVGGTWFLSRLPGRIGVYLGLTGARLKAADCYYTGLSTHHIPSERHDDLFQALTSGKGSLGSSDEAQAAVTIILDMFHEDPGVAPLQSQRELIDHCFAGTSVEDILRRLDAEGSEWSQKTAESIRSKSPLAQKIAFRQMQVGPSLDFDRCMQTEYRLAMRVAGTGDFLEGVRAAIIEKDNAPKWNPASLDAIPQSDVDALFGPLPDGDIQF